MFLTSNTCPFTRTATKIWALFSKPSPGQRMSYLPAPLDQSSSQKTFHTKWCIFMSVTPPPELTSRTVVFGWASNLGTPMELSQQMHSESCYWEMGSMAESLSWAQALFGFSVGFMWPVTCRRWRQGIRHEPDLPLLFKLARKLQSVQEAICSFFQSPISPWSLACAREDPLFYRYLAQVNFWAALGGARGLDSSRGWAL